MSIPIQKDIPHLADSMGYICSFHLKQKPADEAERQFGCRVQYPSTSPVRSPAAHHTGPNAGQAFSSYMRRQLRSISTLREKIQRMPMLTAMLSTALLFAVGCGDRTEELKEPKPQHALVSEQPPAVIDSHSVTEAEALSPERQYAKLRLGHSVPGSYGRCDTTTQPDFSTFISSLDGSEPASLIAARNKFWEYYPPAC